MYLCRWFAPKETGFEICRRSMYWLQHCYTPHCTLYLQQNEWLYPTRTSACVVTVGNLSFNLARRPSTGVDKTLSPPLYRHPRSLYDPIRPNQPPPRLFPKHPSPPLFHPPSLRFEDLIFNADDRHFPTSYRYRPDGNWGHLSPSTSVKAG